MDCFYHDCEEKKKGARKNIYMNMTMKLPDLLAKELSKIAWQHGQIKDPLDLSVNNESLFMHMFYAISSAKELCLLSFYLSNSLVLQTNYNNRPNGQQSQWLVINCYTFTPLDLNNQIQIVMTITMLFIYSQSIHAISVWETILIWMI